MPMQETYYMKIEVHQHQYLPYILYCFITSTANLM